MTIFQAILLGVIQGVAEFLPISSSGHLSVFQNFFGMTTAEDSSLFFDVLLHLGTLVSVCVVYRREILGIITDSIGYVKEARHPVPGGRKDRPGARLLIMMVIATLPLFVVLPFNDAIEKLYYNTTFIGIAFLVTGCILFLTDRVKNGRKNEKTMTPLDALLIGVAQAIATFPGISRSGMTIAAGMATGQDRSYAARFSFLISIPAILGANILSLAKALSAGIDASEVPAYLIGMVVAMVVGYFSVSLVKKVCQAGHFGRFSYYLWFAGVVTIILSIVL